MNRASADDALRRALQRAVGSQYEIIRLLGRGGMGAVYLARDTLERLVAIKVILPHAFLAGARERFRREMRTVARFSHPNIVPIYASGELDQLDYFVMMYVSGDTVAERLRKEPRMPAEEVRRILVDLADALHYAHGMGVVHRDVKPANVMIDDLTGRAFLTDFGVAKMLNPVTTQSTGNVAGTLGYMPPEAFEGAAVDHRADIYSLGVLGYEMLAGRRPFSGENAIQLIHQTVNTPAAPLGSVVADIPADLEAVIMRCLGKDPGQRYRDAHHLRAALGLNETDEATMPQDLRDMAGFGSWTLLWISVWGTFALRAVDRPVLGVTLFVIAMVVPTGFVLQVAGMRPARLPLLQIARVAFWPPKWWGMWWPRRLRRPVDLWPRLPIRARLTRIVLSAFLIGVPSAILLVTENDSVAAALPRFLPLLGAGIALLAAVVVGVLIDAGLWARRKGLDGREIIRMLIGPTIVSGLWDSARVLPLLALHRSTDAPDPYAEPRDPRECVDKIKRLANKLVGASRESGVLALGAVRQLCGEIDALDDEIRDLTGDSSPERIAELEREVGDSAGVRPERTSGGRRRTRAEKEIERLRAIDARLAVASKERARLLATQQEIWSAIVALSHLAPDDQECEALRSRIRRLCARLEGPEDTGGSPARVPLPPVTPLDLQQGGFSPAPPG